jgi:hypothetical protein
MRLATPVYGLETMVDEFLMELRQHPQCDTA